MTDLENFFNTHTHHFDSKTSGIVQLNEPPASDFTSYFSLGIHPEKVNSSTQEIEAIVTSQISNSNFLAIGEIGLDPRFPDMDLQEEIYIKQLQLAAELQKSVILHCVNTWDRCRFLHQKHAPDTSLIYHGFNKVSIIDHVLEYEKAMVSIGASILTNIQLQNAVETLPISRLLIETDDAEISIGEIYQKLAEIKSLNLRHFSDQIRENVKLIFGI